jgi:hypothetical protein
MSYSIDTNVLGRISHIRIPSGLLVSEFREEVFSEINIQIQKLYTVPVVSTSQTEMDFLRDIEADIAGGRLIMDVALVQEAENLHEYGVELAKRGQKKLDLIIGEKVILVGAEKDTDFSDDQLSFPKIQGKAVDEYGFFDRPIAGVENDAIEGKTDAEKYNSLEDTKTI